MMDDEFNARFSEIERLLILICENMKIQHRKDDLQKYEKYRKEWASTLKLVREMMNKNK